MPPPIEYPLIQLSVNQINPYPEWYICEREYRGSGVDCLCGKENIKDCIWIQNRYTGQREIVGSSCMKYFGDVKPLCKECDIYPTTTMTATLCEHCRGGKRTAPTFIVTCGKYKGKTYNDVKADVNYSRWVISLPTFMDKHLYAFLRKEARLDRSRWIIPSTAPFKEFIAYKFPTPESLRFTQTAVYTNNGVCNS